MIYIYCIRHPFIAELMNILFTRELATRLKDTNVTVNALHPGVVRTSVRSICRTILLIYKNALKVSVEVLRSLHNSYCQCCILFFKSSFSKAIAASTAVSPSYAVFV